MARSRAYQEDLLKASQDPEEAKAYLNAALEDGNEVVFLKALRNMAEADSQQPISTSGNSMG